MVILVTFHMVTFCVKRPSNAMTTIRAVSRIVLRVTWEMGHISDDRLSAAATQSSATWTCTQRP